MTNEYAAQLARHMRRRFPHVEFQIAPALLGVSVVFDRKDDPLGEIELAMDDFLAGWSAHVSTCPTTQR